MKEKNINAGLEAMGYYLKVKFEMVKPKVLHFLFNFDTFPVSTRTGPISHSCKNLSAIAAIIYL